MATLSFICGTANAQGNRDFEWLNPPATWQVSSDGRRLSVETDDHTDFWQRTHYGFQAATGHLLHTEIQSYASLQSRIVAFPQHQFDQAGLMVWFDEDCWLKASVEYEPAGPSQLGAVVTNHGYSDWSLQDFTPPDKRFEYRLRIRREKDDFFVEYGAGGLTEDWKPIRVAHLSPEPGSAGRCVAGLYACSPKGKGFRAQFDSLAVESKA